MAHNTFLSRQPAYITIEPPPSHTTHTRLVAQLLRLPVSAHTHAAITTAASAMRACATQLHVVAALHVTYPGPGLGGTTSIPPSLIKMDAHAKRAEQPTPLDA
jgi:hypothetical protein